jgi:hypothetical protein
MIQYSEESMMESRNRGVLDTRFRGYDSLLWRSAVQSQKPLHGLLRRFARNDGIRWFEIRTGILSA